MAFVEIIPLARCQKGGGTFVRHGDLELAVFRLTDTGPCGTSGRGTGPGGSGFQPVGADVNAAPDENVIVIDNACPHAGGDLSGGEIVGNRVTCRWHHWTFDLDTGECTDSPHLGARVRRYPAEIRDGVVWSDLSSGTDRQEAG